MNNIYEPYLILPQIRQPCARRVGIVEQPEPFEGGESVVDLPVGCLDGVGEAREEAGEAEEEEEDDCQGASGGVTRTVLGEDRYEKLEG